MLWKWETTYWQIMQPNSVNLAPQEWNTWLLHRSKKKKNFYCILYFNRSLHTTVCRVLILYCMPRGAASPHCALLIEYIMSTEPLAGFFIAPLLGTGSHLYGWLNKDRTSDTMEDSNKESSSFLSPRPTMLVMSETFKWAKYNFGQKRSLFYFMSFFIKTIKRWFIQEWITCKYGILIGLAIHSSHSYKTTVVRCLVNDAIYFIN